jgi:hypothetical protein
MDVFVMITDIGTVVLVIAVVSTNFLLEKSIAASDWKNQRTRERGDKKRALPQRKVATED